MCPRATTLARLVETRTTPKPSHGAGPVSGDCWEWSGWNSGNGYGKVKYRGQTYMAHRLIWTLSGREIERGEVLDHLCRNRACVNPQHMEAVKVRENTLRGQARLFCRRTG